MRLVVKIKTILATLVGVVSAFIPASAMAQSSYGEDRELIAGLVMVGMIVLALYFIPTIVAFVRKHPNRWPILLINAVFGATVLGWLGSLIWAFSAIHRSTTGNHGGESGLNLFANDAKTVRIEGPTAAPTDHIDPVSQLSRLKGLHSQGSLTDEEYAALKQPLLQRMLG